MCSEPRDIFSIPISHAAAVIRSSLLYLLFTHLVQEIRLIMQPREKAANFQKLDSDCQMNGRCETVKAKSP